MTVRTDRRPIRARRAGASAGFALALSALLVAGCATGTSEREGRDLDLITAEELAPLAGMNAFEVIRELRPHWLRTRGVASFQWNPDEGPRIRIDEMAMVYQDLLTVDASAIREMRYLSATEATFRFGTGYPHGVILVTTRSR